MAKYTITIKTLIDNNFNFQLTNYPIFDENYRTILNNKILNHYYENEIGFETAALFRFYLNQKLNEIMPYYNQLYTAQKYIIDNNLLLNNINLTEELKGSNDRNDTNTTTQTNKSQTDTINNTTTNTSSNSNSSNNGTSKNKNLFQDTPQGQITQSELEDQTWATNVTFNNNTTTNTINDTSSSEGTANNTINNTSDSTNNINNSYNSNATNTYIKTLIGNTGNKFNIDLLKDIENNLINIDLRIINDLNELFMQIF